MSIISQCCIIMNRNFLHRKPLLDVRYILEYECKVLDYILFTLQFGQATSGYDPTRISEISLKNC